MELKSGPEPMLILARAIGFACVAGLLQLTLPAPFGTESGRVSSPQSNIYSVDQIPAAEGVEYRFKLNDFHFMSLVHVGGIFDLRPHPGCDINGWGSSWYAQPYLPGATLTHTTISAIATDAGGVHLTATGKVSRNLTDSFGIWTTVIGFQYSPSERLVLGRGRYTITLAGPLSGATGDLNLYKIASNYLYSVPLRSGGYGDTGDMKAAEVTAPGMSGYAWIPPNQPSHFPNDQIDSLSIDVLGNYNTVDTLALSQTTIPIASAYKPDLSVTLTSQQPNIGMIFGGVYGLPLSRTFWADNVGITPLILAASTKTEFDFDVGFASRALEFCNYLPSLAQP